MTSGRIVVVGSVNRDMMLRCEHLPGPGETVSGRDFATAPGGKGANQAIAAARLGAAVSFVGCVGDDEFGVAARAALARDGVDTQHLAVVPGQATGVAMVLTDAAGENCIALSPGANASLGPHHLDAAAASWAGAAMLLCQLESPLPTVRHAVDLAGQRGVPVLLNPAPAQALPVDLLAKVSIIVPNAVEAGLLVGAPVQCVRDALHAAAHLLALGPSTVIVTLGAQGIVVATPRMTRYRPAPLVEAVDSTGAGDTFVGALAAVLAEGAPLLVAADLAQRAAAFSVTRRGAQASMPHRDELQAWEHAA